MREVLAISRLLKRSDACVQREVDAVSKFVDLLQQGAQHGVDCCSRICALGYNRSA